MPDNAYAKALIGTKERGPGPEAKSGWMPASPIAIGKARYKSEARQLVEQSAV
jgi:hypothetical protein